MLRPVRSAHGTGLPPLALYDSLAARYSLLVARHSLLDHINTAAKLTITFRLDFHKNDLYLSCNHGSLVDFSTWGVHKLFHKSTPSCAFLCASEPPTTSCGRHR